MNRIPLILGSLLLTASLALPQQETTRIRTLTGALANGFSGWSAAIAGDVNADGFDDIIVGAPFHDGPNGTDAGVALVYDGHTGQVIHTLDGPFAGRRFGLSVTGLGDVNGDGHDDFAVGGFGNSTGIIRVFSGASGGLFVTLQDFAGWGLGTAIASAGDVDGDGRGDLVAGLPFQDSGSMTNVGEIRVYTIAPFGQISSHTGTHPNQQLGFSVGRAGDINGDGLEDVVAGAPFYNPGLPNAAIGRVEVFSPAGGGGSAPIVDFIPNIGAFGNNAQAGYSVAGIGDVNGDGIPDIACGAPGYETNTANNLQNGRVYAVSGVQVPFQSATVLWTRTATASSAERFGNSIRALGTPGTTPLSLVVSSPDASISGSDLGKISVLEGASGLIRDRHHGYGDGDGFGDGLGAGGDIDGDGIQDYVVGAPNYDNFQSFIGVSNSGRTFAFSSAPDDRNHIMATGFQVNPGHRVAVLGDTNDDGYDEYLIGYPGNGTGGQFGRVRAYDGQSGSLLYVIDQDALAPNELGEDISTVGDVNGDGAPDFLAGAPGTAPRGAAFLYSGVDGTLLGSFFGGIGASRFGESVSGGSDVNGDGTPDLFIGDPDHAGGFGRVTILDGATLGILTFIGGSSTGGRLGSDIAALGDIDGDGFGEVAVGLEGESIASPGDQAGQLRVYSGSPGGSLFLVASLDGSNGERLGAAIAAAGDVNGDGAGDVVVGGPRYTSTPFLGPPITDRGRVRVFDVLGGAILFSLLGDNAGDQLGFSVSGAGDVDGDGRGDFIAGAPFADLQGSTDLGYAYVYRGDNGAIARRFEGSTLVNSLGNGGTQMGRSVAGGARITPDTLSDVLVSSSHGYSPGTGFKTVIYGLGDFPGLTHYGNGTPACDGPVRLDGNSVPDVGNSAFELRCFNAEGLSTGDLLVTTTGFQSPAGLDPTGLGIILHVDWINAPPVGSVAFTCDAAGAAAIAAPLPNIPALAGFVLSFQAILYSNTTCPGPVFGYSTTNGLDMTIQP